MSLFPASIQRIDRDIVIQWSDDTRRKYRPQVLRDACPCAICRERKNAEHSNRPAQLVLPVLSKEETLPLEIRKMEPVGNYAYNIHFSDGHNSGIFTFELLASLGE